MSNPEDNDALETDLSEDEDINAPASSQKVDKN